MFWRRGLLVLDFRGVLGEGVTGSRFPGCVAGGGIKLVLDFRGWYGEGVTGSRFPGCVGGRG